MSDKVKQMSGADRSNGYMEALGRTAVAVAAAHVHFGLMVYGYAPWMDKVVFFCIFFCFFFLSPLFSSPKTGWADFLRILTPTFLIYLTSMPARSKRLMVGWQHRTSGTRAT